MPPSIAPPTPDEVASLMATHADRYPEKAKLTAPGEDGASVTLPILLGNPPAGPAWSQAVAIAVRLVGAGGLSDDALLRECILWPPPATWRSWCDHWPALEAPAMKVAVRKFAMGVEFYDAPATGDEPPEGLKHSSRGCFRILKPRPDIKRWIAVETPSADAWRAFLKFAQTPGEDVSKHAREMADVVTGGSAADLLDRFPGLVPSIVKTAAHLAGAGAEGELGKW